MKVRKGFNIFFLFLFIAIVQTAIIPSANALALYLYGPEKIDYEPGLELSIPLKVDNTGRDVSLSVSGKVGRYAALDKDIIRAEDTDRWFTLTVKFPRDTTDLPGGRTKLYIKAEEAKKVDGGAVGTSVTAITYIWVHVVHQGKYIEINSFSISDINIDEILKPRIEINNFGSLDINSIKVRFEIYSLADELIASKDSEETELKKGEIKIISTEIDTKDNDNFLPAHYKARAIVFWDNEESEATTEFRIGSLYVNILDYSKVFKEKTINPFFIEIESRWNNDIKNIYAQINISNILFKTPSTELKPWERQRLETYFDATNLDIGTYPIHILLFYEGQLTKEDGMIEVVEAVEEPAEEKPQAKILGLNATALLIIVIILIVLADLVWLKLRKKKKP